MIREIVSEGLATTRKRIWDFSFFRLVQNFNDDNTNNKLIKVVLWKDFSAQRLKASCLDDSAGSNIKSNLNSVNNNKQIQSQSRHVYCR